MSPHVKIFWLTLDRGTRFAASLVSNAMIARSLTPSDFGILTQALLLLALLDTLSSLGLPAVIGARVAVSPQGVRPGLLLRALSLRTSVATGCALLTYGTISVSAIQAPAGLIATMLFALALTNWSMSDGYLQGIDHPQSSAVVKSCVALSFVLIRWLHFTQMSPSATSWSLIYCAEQATLSAVMLVTCWKVNRRARQNDTSRVEPGVPFLRYSMIMWASQLVTLVYMRVDQAIISALGEHSELAQYAIASQLVEQAYTLPIILNAVFIGRIGVIQQSASPADVHHAMQKLYQLGFRVACGITALGIMLAPVLVPAIYGERYRSSSALLMILMLAIPFVTLGSLQTLSIFTGSNPSIQLKKTAFAAAISIPLGVIGWQIFHLPGLAVAAVVVQVLSCFLINRLFDPDQFRNQVNALIRVRWRRE
jgi:O-antigen/teichoic acid export membrane protein